MIEITNAEAIIADNKNATAPFNRPVLPMQGCTDCFLNLTSKTGCCYFLCECDTMP